ncbi:MAG: hypothetical protein AAFX44_00040 [Pseudomonadota bacterium]
MNWRRTPLAVTAFAVFISIAALVVMYWLPPPRATNPINYFGLLSVYVLLGPLLFAWAWGPGTMPFVALAAAVLLPVLAIAMLFLGFSTKRSALWLAAAGLLWGTFGGFSAFMAVSGSI